MRAAVLRGGSVEARVIDDPVAGPGQILVRSLACGICASDLHFMDHPEAGADDDSGMSTYDTDADIVMGHEYCAEVAGYGPGTERRIPVGTRVSSLPVLATAGGRKIIGQNPESPDPSAGRFWVFRVSANTWRWVRTPQGWRIAERVNAPLDGTPGHREMLAPPAVSRLLGEE